MTTCHRCDQCKKDLGVSKGKVNPKEWVHLCSYLCAFKYYEKQYFLYEEEDRQAKHDYWDRQDAA